MDLLSIAAFPFPTEPHKRSHGPIGYSEYKGFKEWLRDEYVFRCAYCLVRESWFGDGKSSFSIDHFRPKSIARGLANYYDNLLYCCRMCNSIKGKKVGLRSPDEIGFGSHIRQLPNGEVEALTPQGRILRDLLKLNSRERVNLRLKKLNLEQIALSIPNLEDEALKKRLIFDMEAEFGYPFDLPNLALMEPPDGNSRPEGIETSHLARQLKGQLPKTY